MGSSLVDRVRVAPQVRFDRLDCARTSAVPIDTVESKQSKLEDPGQVVDEIRATLGDTDLTIFGALAKVRPKWSASSVAGSLVTALLLSLGAQFWYGVVGKLVGFRAAAGGKAKESENQA